MRLYTFEVEGRERIGVEARGRLFEVDEPDMLALVRAGAEGLETAWKAVRFATGPGHPLGETRARAPLPRPGRILRIVYERGRGVPAWARAVDEMSAPIVHPGEPIACPPGRPGVVGTVELGIVIGRPLRGGSEADAAAAIWGYTLLGRVMAGMSDAAALFVTAGPCIVTPDELGDPTDLVWRAFVDDRPTQQGAAAEMDQSLTSLLVLLSEAVPLEPGDVVAVAGSSGAALLARPGNRFALEVEGIGRLEHPVTGGEGGQEPSRGAALGP